MALPELDVARVQRWCVVRVPEHARHQVRVECEVAPRHLTIVERRAPWREDFGPEWTNLPIARLRYAAAEKTWMLFWRDRNLRFHGYDQLAPSRRIDDLLTEVDRDPHLHLLGLAFRTLPAATRPVQPTGQASGQGSTAPRRGPDRYFARECEGAPRAAERPPAHGSALDR